MGKSAPNVVNNSNFAVLAVAATLDAPKTCLASYNILLLPSGRGPAKKLPGVRQLFEKPLELRKRCTRYDIYKRIDASYYGYRDQEDGVLERLEGPAEWCRLEEVRKEARKG